MSSTRPTLNWKDPVHLLAFGLGSGAAPKAPGTFGTLAAIPLYLLVSDLSPGFYVLLLALMFVMGIWLCQRTSDDLGVHDHGGIVWDEWVGFLLTMFNAPAGWLWIVIGFLLFRLFDILKPWPINWLDRKVSGGLGIMLDDILAGVYAWIGLQLSFVLIG
ncbi:MAG: phosphatidylglycerophosphatase A [Chromatiales bacterium]|nr:phosphatidylglycerophosphatase A [Chromatiales bacterium]